MQQRQYVSLFFIGIFLASAVFFLWHSYEGMEWLIGLSACLLGMFLIIFSPLNSEKGYFKEGKTYELTGEIAEIWHTDYYQWVIMRNVSFSDKGKWKKLNTKVEVRMPLEEEITENDLLDVSGESLAQEKQMNPSDFDAPMYLKGKGISAAFKLKNIVNKKRHTSCFETIKECINERIESLYDEESSGVMKACLLGDESELQPDTKAVYNESGIGHVLAISGFHVSVIAGCLIFILGWLSISYCERQWLVILSLWLYAFLTGCSVSTVRACVMATTLMAGRAIWAEADSYTNLSLAAGVLLFINPYQLFQVGFQLSFGAVFGILFCLDQIERLELLHEYQMKSWQKDMVLWLTIQLMTWPILAYYFYEVPFLISFINLAVIPVFSVVIIGGWLSLILGKVWFIGGMLAKAVESILLLIRQMTEVLLKWPFATLCTGRPNLIGYILYGIAVGAVAAMLFHWPIKRIYRRTALLFCMLISISCSLLPGPLKITCLYVGQGDAAVIETPHHQLLVVDGGNKGQGKTLDSYIKYRGSDHIAAMFLSHSDADHINGLIEILQTDMVVGQVFISDTDESELLKTLLSLCREKGIRWTRLKRGEKVKIDGVTIDCLAPAGEEKTAGNDQSMVAVLSYGRFKAVFTGDKECKSQPWIYSGTGPVTLLKVSHHGSRTGTDQALLLNLRPSYAMISCGIHNLYGHPHQEVVEMIKKDNIHLDRTDLEGAVSYETDGMHLIEKSFRKEVSSCP